MASALVGNRTQDPSIKSAVLYQLSYERNIGFYHVYLTSSPFRLHLSQQDSQQILVGHNRKDKNSCPLTQAAGCHGEHHFQGANAMTKSNSTAPPAARKPRKPQKPEKPYEGFPLTPHPCGLWCKQVTFNGTAKLYYFGSWRDDPKGERALERWHEEMDFLKAGRVPRSRLVADSPTLGDLINKFLLAKAILRDNGERSPQTWNSYSDVCDELLATFGQDRLLTDLLPEDFQKLRSRWAAKGWGPVTMKDRINRARVVFNYAYKTRLIPAPIFYSEEFTRPSLKVLRLNRAAKGKMMFEAEELRRMIEAARQPLKAMLLLGINAGLGNADIARLPLSAIDMEGGWLTNARGKTGIDRRCPLWPETIQAIRESLAERPTPKDTANFDVIFITKRGNTWDKDEHRALTHECRKLLDALGIKGNRNFYALRHTVETIGGESKDQVAVKAIMGHVDNDISAAYRERISDARLKGVTDFVHAWLFAKPETGTQKKPRLRIASETRNGDAASA
jgi:integrase